MQQCPLIERCKFASGMDCLDRNFDGKQVAGSFVWRFKEPCDFYKNLIREQEHKLYKKGSKGGRLWKS